MRPASMVGVIAGAVLMLAACGGGDEEATPMGTTTNPPAATVTDTATLDTTTTEHETTTEQETTTAQETTEQETTVVEPGESPEDFFERFLGYELEGQYGRSWDVLHPGHQAVVARERYEECRAERFERFGSVSGELESFDVLEVYEDPIDVPEIPEKTSTAVKMAYSVHAGDETETFTDTAHAIQIGNHWVWVLAPGDVRDYKAGSCPT